MACANTCCRMTPTAPGLDAGLRAGALRHHGADRRRFAGRLGRGSLDLRHLCAAPRRPHASRFQCGWLLAFGSPVARRFGAGASSLFFAGDGRRPVRWSHLATHAGDFAPMVGASAAISGIMAAAMRFAFQPGGPLDLSARRPHAGLPVPAAPLLVALRNPRVIAFLAAVVRPQSPVRPGLAVDRRRRSERSPGRRISAASLRGCCCSPLFDPVRRARGHG